MAFCYNGYNRKRRRAAVFIIQLMTSHKKGNEHEYSVEVD